MPVAAPVPPGRVSRPVCVQKLIEHLGALLGCARCVPPAQRNPRLDARRHERGPVVLQPDAEQLNRLLDFLWGRAAWSRVVDAIHEHTEGVTST